MLKGIPKILSPELLKVLAEMGHSDRLVISDGNFPAESGVPSGQLCGASGKSYGSYAWRYCGDTNLGYI